MKKILLLLILFFNIVPCMKNGHIKLISFIEVKADGFGDGEINGEMIGADGLTNSEWMALSDPSGNGVERYLDNLKPDDKITPEFVKELGNPELQASMEMHTYTTPESKNWVEGRYVWINEPTAMITAYKSGFVWMPGHYETSGGETVTYYTSKPFTLPSNWPTTPDYNNPDDPVWSWIEQNVYISLNNTTTLTPQTYNEPMSQTDIEKDQAVAIIITNDASLTTQPRPSYADMKNHSLPPAPESPNGTPIPHGDGVNTFGYLDVGDKIGGDVKTLLYNDPNPNTCATRLSYALNHSSSTTPIPANVGPYTGKDGTNYIVGVKSMLAYLTKVYSTPDIHLSTIASQPLTQAYIKQQLYGKQGIFVIIARDQSQSTGFGATGHVDLLAPNGNFADHDYTNPRGGTSDVYLFILK